jgi:hypothetical protein
MAEASTQGNRCCAASGGLASHTGTAGIDRCPAGRGRVPDGRSVVPTSLTGSLRLVVGAIYLRLGMARGGRAGCADYRVGLPRSGCARNLSGGTSSDRGGVDRPTAGVRRVYGATPPPRVVLLAARSDDRGHDPSSTRPGDGQLNRSDGLVSQANEAGRLRPSSSYKWFVRPHSRSTEH